MVQVLNTTRTAAPPYSAFAAVYDSLLGNRLFPEMRRVFEWLARRYGIRFASAGDAACGTGTFVRYLRRRGVPLVYGVDRSAAMLHIARSKNQGNGARFLRQDLTGLSLPRLVDLITCQFDSLNYLIRDEDLRQAMLQFRGNLAPGGHLVFDVVVAPSGRRALPPRVENAVGPGAAVHRVTTWDPEKAIQTAVVTIRLNKRLHREVHRQRRYSVGVVRQLLDSTGFDLRGVHDFRTRGPVTAATRRAVFVAQVRERKRS